ncbi:hypothetical protein HYH03_001755 [Edaphochlamys debaryana]|uniref:Phytol kinase n=1 Tax=Edaphochlamys debaryana TaxID=47281 RepID=A0A836C5L8_9CHLO|nr:hypothetical protein HYH03_001755 [Edaphochlamys debaryana]|eukprot:KAG2500173.1 hypothetical protein HYH03_001755 [Edaphochlamys debaryana]
MLAAISLADWLAFAQTAVIALVVLVLSLIAGRSGRFERSTTRKALHIGMGATYALYWPLYSDAPYAPYLCAMVPLTATVVFFAVGLGLVPFDPLVRAATRSGQRQELLTGPTLYGLVHVALTVLYFTRSPSGVVAVAVLCFGDGAAELVGRRATARLWHNSRKTWAGSLACLLAAWAASSAYALLFWRMGLYGRPVEAGELLQGCALASLAGTLAESLPLDGDNLWVPLAAAGTCVWCFGF